MSKKVGITELGKVVQLRGRGLTLLSLHADWIEVSGGAQLTIP